MTIQAEYQARIDSGQTENAAISRIAKRHSLAPLAVSVLLTVFDSFEAAADCIDELTTPATAGSFLIMENESGGYRVCWQNTP